MRLPLSAARWEAASIGISPWSSEEVEAPCPTPTCPHRSDGFPACTSSRIIVLRKAVQQLSERLEALEARTACTRPHVPPTLVRANISAIGWSGLRWVCTNTNGVRDRRSGDPRPRPTAFAGAHLCDSRDGRRGREGVPSRATHRLPQGAAAVGRFADHAGGWLSLGGQRDDRALQRHPPRQQPVRLRLLRPDAVWVVLQSPTAEGVRQRRWRVALGFPRSGARLGLGDAALGNPGSVGTCMPVWRPPSP